MMEKLSAEALQQRCAVFDANYKDVRARVEAAAAAAGRRPSDIVLLAATKTVPPQIIDHAVSRGITHIGENRVQEFLEKEPALTRPSHRHFIGHLQTNKVKDIVGRVEMIESVDSFRLAQTIDRLCAQQGRIMDVLAEVNIGKEPNKSGFAPEQTRDAVRRIASLEHLRVRGLMCIPPLCGTPAQARAFFQKMRDLFLDIASQKIDNSNMVYLSMGMSHDFEAAIEQGANLIRVGTALFGARK